MKKFSGYEDAKKNAEYSGSKQIPVGAYVCKVMAVRYDAAIDDQSDRITIQFDVAEGDQKDFFREQYNANTSEDKKWKGRTTIYLPKDDGSEKDTWTKNNFARWTKAFEDSNNGYVWDWDENKWKGKLIGLVFGPTGTRIEGKDVIYNEVHGVCSVKEAREGTFWKGNLELKKKNGYQGTTSASSSNNSDGFMSIPNGAPEEIPFL